MIAPNVRSFGRDLSNVDSREFSAKRVDQAMSLLREMLSKGVVPDVATFSFLMGGYFPHRESSGCTPAVLQNASLSPTCKWTTLFMEDGNVHVIHYSIFIGGLWDKDKGELENAVDPSG